MSHKLIYCLTSTHSSCTVSHTLIYLPLCLTSTHSSCLTSPHSLPLGSGWLSHLGGCRGGVVVDAYKHCIQQRTAWWLVGLTCASVCFTFNTATEHRWLASLTCVSFATQPDLFATQLFIRHSRDGWLSHLEVSYHKADMSHPSGWPRNEEAFSMSHLCHQ